MITHVRRRSLAVLASMFTLAVVGSYCFMQHVSPSLFPYWGYVLLGLLGSWAGASSGVLLASVASRHKLAVFGLVVAAAVTGAGVHGSGFVALGVALMSTIVVGAAAVFLGVCRLLRRAVRPQMLLVGFLLMLVAAIVVGVNVAASWQPAVPGLPMPTGDELHYLATTEQLDRRTGHFVLNASRDRTRLRRVLALDRQEQLIAPAHQYHAALIYQHGECPPDWRRAYELACTAVRAGYADPDELWKGAYDRWMLSLGKSQVYGTQHSLSVSAACAAR